MKRDFFKYGNVEYIKRNEEDCVTQMKNLANWAKYDGIKIKQRMGVFVYFRGENKICESVIRLEKI